MYGERAAARQRDHTGLSRMAALGFRISIAAALTVAGLVFCDPAHASFDDGAQAYRDNDYQAAVAEWRPLAEQGDRSAQFGLGVAYEHGTGVPVDLIAAAHWYRKAAERGLATAQFKLGNLYYTGRGVPKDQQEALRWHRQAADNGLAIAQMNLAYAYEVGDGVEKDLLKAAHWYQRAAEQGALWAQDRLAVLYAEGISPAAMSPDSDETPAESPDTQASAARSAEDATPAAAPQDRAEAVVEARVGDDASAERQAAQDAPAHAAAAVAASTPAEKSEPAEIEIAHADTAEIDEEEADEPEEVSLAESLRIRLASYRDRAKAEKGWKILSHRYSDLLGSLSYTLQPVDLGPGKGKFLRLEAGPLTSLAQANELCAEIERRGGDDCVTVRP